MNQIGKSLLLFLHGSGDDGSYLNYQLTSLSLPSIGQSFAAEVSGSLQLDLLTPGSLFVLLYHLLWSHIIVAHSKPYSPANMMNMHVWFDRSTEFDYLGRNDNFEDDRGIDSSIDSLVKLIDSQEPYVSLIIGGFSMGGGMSLHLLDRIRTIPRFESRLLGAFAISSYLVSSSRIFSNTLPNSSDRKIPIFMMHGTADSLIRYAWGRETFASLEAMDDRYRGTFKRFSVDHDLDPIMVRYYTYQSNREIIIYVSFLSLWIGCVKSCIQCSPIICLIESSLPALSTLSTSFFKLQKIRLKLWQVEILWPVTLRSIWSLHYIEK